MNTGLTLKPLPLLRKCGICGKLCRDGLCIDCRYHGGSKIRDDLDVHQRDTVEQMRRADFRDGFTSDQLQQASPSER